MAFSDSLSCVRRSLHKSFSMPGQQSGTVCGVDIPNVWYPPQSNKWEHMSSFENFEKMLGSFSASVSSQNQETTNNNKTTNHCSHAVGTAFSERKYFEDDAEKNYNSLYCRPKGGISSYAWLNAFSGIEKADPCTSKAELENGTSRGDSVADLATFLSSTPATLERRTSLRNQNPVDKECINLSNASQHCETEMLLDTANTVQSTSTSGDQLPGMSLMSSTLTPMTSQPRNSCAVVQATIDKFTSYRTMNSDAHVANEQDEDDARKLFDPRKPISEEELKPQPIIRKARKVHVADEFKDNKYWKRRLKNNVAARRSREARRMKENQIAMRASFLEKENDALRMEVKRLRKELKSIMGSRTSFIANQDTHPSFISTL